MLTFIIISILFFISYLEFCIVINAGYRRANAHQSLRKFHTNRPCLVVCSLPITKLKCDSTSE